MLTTGELARLLSVTPVTVINWMESGRLPFERLGPRGRRRIREQDVRDYMKREGIDPQTLDPVLWSRVLADTRPSLPAPALFIVDRGFQCIHWNSAAQKLLGWNSTDVLGSGLEFVNARVPGMEVDLRALSVPPSETDVHLSLQVEMRHRDGSWIPLELTLNWIRGRSRELEGTAFVLQKREA